MSNWVYETWIKGMEAKERRSSEGFKFEFLHGDWPINRAVYSREEVENMVGRGEISPQCAEALLQLRYAVTSKGEKVVESV